MTKITIISCIIVAVCILQTAQAGLFDKSPIKRISESLLDNVSKGVSNTLGNVKEVGEKIRKGKETIDGVKNGIGTAEKEIQESTSACTKVYDEGREALNDMVSIFESCITNETLSASADVQKLTDAFYNLEANLTKEFQNALQCFKNVFTAMPCLTKVLQNVTELSPLIEETVNSAFELLEFVPNVKECYKTSLDQQNLGKLVKDAQQCVQSVLKPFI